MSGGHFNYKEESLIEIIRGIEEDMRLNPGYDHSPKTVIYLHFLIKDIKRIYDLINAYDYAVSSDSSIEKFNELAEKSYG